MLTEITFIICDKIFLTQGSLTCFSLRRCWSETSEKAGKWTFSLEFRVKTESSQIVFFFCCNSDSRSSNRESSFEDLNSVCLYVCVHQCWPVCWRWRRRGRLPGPGGQCIQRDRNHSGNLGRCLCSAHPCDTASQYTVDNKDTNTHQHIHQRSKSGSVTPLDWVDYSEICFEL